MSALEKVEEAYLGMLRLAIVVVSSLLLVAALGLGLMYLSDLGNGDRAPVAEAAVKAEDVISRVAAEPEKAGHRQSAPGKKRDDLGSDPNRPYYERTADAIVKFSEKYAPGYFDIQPDRLIGILRERVDRYKDNPRIAATFAYGMSEAMEKSLASPAIIKRVEKPAKAQAAKAEAPEGETGEASPASALQETPFKESPFQVAEEILDAYTALFDEKTADTEKLKARLAAEETERREAARMQLYMAGGALAGFLFLVLISILVKIERNLRDIASLAK